MLLLLPFFFFLCFSSLLRCFLCPPPQEHLPDVLTSIAHKFGLDLSVDLRAVGGKRAGGAVAAEKRSVLGTEVRDV